jgi:hypothetical protein
VKAASRKLNRGHLLGKVLLFAIVAFVVIGATAIAAPAPSSKNGEARLSAAHNSRSEHWGVIARNTIGSPVAALRTGPFGSFGVTDAPPFGKGSLGIEVADAATMLTSGGPAEKVDFGNEVDFFGDQVLALNQVGFHVFQTAENVGFGGPRNMPNIRFEIDPNKIPTTNFTTMVWNPPAAPALNRWSGFIDAATTGDWYFTGSTGILTGCNQVTTCTFTQAKMSLDDGSPTPIFFSVAVGKGRDNLWAGAVDGLRMNTRVFDFEPDRVRERGGDDG